MKEGFISQIKAINNICNFLITAHNLKSYHLAKDDEAIENIYRYAKKLKEDLNRKDKRGDGYVPKEDELFGEWQKNFVYDFSLGAIRKRKKQK